MDGLGGKARRIQSAIRPVPQPVSPAAESQSESPVFTYRRASQQRKVKLTPRVPVRRIALGIIGVLGSIVILSAAWVGLKVISNASKILGSKNGNVLGLLSSTKLKGEESNRINILLAGDSADDPGHGGGNLTDSIMIVSIDTKTNSAFMMSIPRDLWVNIPGNGYAKINAANAYGEAEHFNQSGYPAGGMGLLEKVIEQNFQIPINYYALVDYTAFRDGVNAIGGIDITVASKDVRGIYDPNIAKADNGPLRLKNGLVHLDGQTALNLARARNDPTPSGQLGYGLPNGDFDRAANQRLMLISLKNKIISGGTLANPVKLGQLLDALGNNVHSDFQTNELRRLYDIGKSINTASIQSLSLNDPAHGVVLIQNYTTSDGQAALVPAAGVTNFSQIRAYFKKLSSDDPVTKESAKVVVLNGSSVDGLAKKQMDALVAKNLDVTAIGNASQPYTTTAIIDNSKGLKPASKKLLSSLFGSAITTNAALTTAYPDADFIILLGADQAKLPTTASP